MSILSWFSGSMGGRYIRPLVKRSLDERVQGIEGPRVQVNGETIDPDFDSDFDVEDITKASLSFTLAFLRL